MSRALELAGLKFGHLTVLRRAEVSEIHPIHYKHDRGHVWWVAQCECGKLRIAPGNRIKNGNVNSCGCYKGRTLPFGESAKWAYFQWYKHFSQRRKKTFTLTIEEFLRITGSPCHYCGVRHSTAYPNYNKKDGTPKYHGAYQHNGIDRIDSAIGYVSDNCVPCCQQCNYAKNDSSVEEFKTWLQRAYLKMFNQQLMESTK